MRHPTAVVETERIGAGTVIHPYAVIGRDVVIGRNCTIHPHVVLEGDVRIGDGVEIFPGSYLGKRPQGAGATARPLRDDGPVEIGDGCAIGPHAVVYRDVRIGRNTLLGDGAAIREQVRIGDFCIISRFVTVNYETSIGSRTKIMDQTHITGKCRVGDDVFIGMLVSTANDNSLLTREYDEAATQGPQIDDGATIGTGAIVFPSVRLGAKSLVGAGAVVTRDVAPGDVVMGMPARVVRSLNVNNAGG